MNTQVNKYIHDLNSVIGDLRQYLPWQLHQYGLMQYDEKFLLIQLSRSLAPESVVVEVGSYLGASAAIMSHANPLVDVHCFDPFEDADFRQNDGYGRALLASALGPDTPRTLEGVTHLLKGFDRIHLHQGYSPWDFMTWTTPVDLYVEDGLHQNPEFAANIDFWSSKLKIGGLMAIHDHRYWLEPGVPLHFSDVINRVAELRTDPAWQYVGQIYSLVVFEKVSDSGDRAAEHRAALAFVAYQKSKLSS